MSTTKKVVSTLPLEQGEAPNRVARGLFRDTLKGMTPGSKVFFKVPSAQRQSVIQAAYNAGFKVQTQTERDKNKKPTGFIKIWRKQ